MTRHVYTNSPDHLNDSDGRAPIDVPQYALPVARGANRAHEIAMSIDADVDASNHATYVHDVPVHVHLDPARVTRDHRADVYVPIDWHAATASGKRVTRGKTGTSTTITTRGRVVVVGDSHAFDDELLTPRVPRVVVSHAIDELRTGNRFGHVDGNALARLTDRLYGDSIPALIGTDHYGWSEASPEIPMDSHALQALIVTTVGLSGGADRTLDTFAAPRGHGAHYGTLTAYKRKGRTFPRRTRVHVPRERKTDVKPRTRFVLRTDHHAAYGATSNVWCAVEVRGSGDDDTTMFVGYRRVARGATVHGKRTSRTAIVETFTVRTMVELATVAASLRSIGAARYGWQCGSATGTMTVDKRGRVSIVGNGVEIRQTTSLATLRKLLAAA